jgi:hypothetical protein
MFSQLSKFYLIILQIVGAEDVDSKEELGVSSSCQEAKKREADITYGIDDIPPWYLCIFMALQVRRMCPCVFIRSFVR